MKRVIIFKNGTEVDGKVVLVTHSLDELLTTAGNKFGIVAKRIFTEKGGEIDDLKLVRDDDILYVSAGENFIPHKSLSYCRHSCKGGNDPCSSSAEDQVTVAKHDPAVISALMDLTMEAKQLPPNSGHWVTLNVGGKYFTTSRSTLINKEPSSMLARMFAEREGGLYMSPSNVDSKGAYLIDRSPAYFEPILNYLRNGQLIFDSSLNAEGILEEARFFGIDSVIPQLENMITQGQQTRDNLPLSRRDVINALISTPFTAELRFQGVNLAGSDLSRLDLRSINLNLLAFTGAAWSVPT
uniref:BTB/POZ domain-containing protein KCTD9 n=2 Tax=Lygus hesperus TaxID=30085 RepID=A0A0A9YV15_LYGHE